MKYLQPLFYSIVAAQYLILSLFQVPGVPIMYLQSHRYTIERLPEATLGGAPRN
jgi:hypothetical protein